MKDGNVELPVIYVRDRVTCARRDAEIPVFQYQLL